MSPSRADDRPEPPAAFPSARRGDDLGRALLRARIERGLTQERLAEAVVQAGAAAGESLRLTGSAVSRWEHGRFVPALRYRRFIAQVLGLDIGALVPVESRRPRPNHHRHHDRRT